MKKRTLFDSCVWFGTCCFFFNVFFVKDLPLEKSASCMEDNSDMFSRMTIVTRVVAASPIQTPFYIFFCYPLLPRGFQ